MRFDEHQLLESKGSTLKLSKDDLEQLFKKVEYTKKKKALDTKNELYDLYHGGQNEFTEKEVEKMLNAFEYTFKKKSQDPLLQKMKEFAPDWMGIKYSSITAKEKRDKREAEKE